MSVHAPVPAVAEAQREVERRRATTSRVSRWLPLPALVAVSPMLVSALFDMPIARGVIFALALLAVLPFVAMASLLVWRYHAGRHLVDALREQRLERLQGELTDSLPNTKTLRP